MHRLILAVLFVIGLNGPLSAQGSDDPITGVIQDQIEAFQEDDFATAFSFASPMIKRLFGSPDRFGLMVRQGYPMVWRPADVEYLDQKSENGVVYQNVLITDRQGVPHMLEYQMIQTSDGWQINGVQFLQPPAVGA